MSSSESEESQSTSLKHKLLGGAFLVSVTGASIIFGFGSALALEKKKDPKFFAKGFSASRELPESGGSLALRALGRGTLYAVSGFGLFCFGMWKLIGASNFEEFRYRIGSVLPKIPKHEPQGRSDFKSVRELVNYIIEESDKESKP